MPLPADHPSSAFDEPRRILVRGVNWLGDAVMTTPALQRLRERFPAAHIALLTQEKLAQLWAQHPSLNDVLAFKHGAGPWSVAAAIKAAGGPGGAAPFDLALVLPNSPRSALETWLAHIPERVGYARPWRNWLLTRAVPARAGHIPVRKRSVSQINRLVQAAASGASRAPAASPQFGRALSPKGPRPGRFGEAAPPQSDASLSGSAHQVHDYLHLAGALGANSAPLPPTLHLSPAELEQAERKFLVPARGQWGDGAPGESLLLLGLNPGAEYGPAKRWPAERFAAAARQIASRKKNCAWLLFGGPRDRELCERIAQDAGGSMLNLAGQTSLRELMALLKLCRALLTNDTGPMHVAAALGTPVVVPFGSTSPELTGPGLPGGPGLFLLRSDAPCSPCFRRTCPIDLRCMTGISVDQVVEAVWRAAGLS